MTTSDAAIEVRALVIDRASEMRSALGMALAEAGVATIDYASKQTAALGYIQNHSYDVVLCEYDLGGGQDGVHLFEACQQHHLLKPSCIFMMVTGERRHAQVMSAAELVPDGYLLKPFSTADLIMRLARAQRRKAGFRTIDNAVRAGDYLGAISACDREMAERPPAEIDDFMRMKTQLQLRLGEHADAAQTSESALALRNSAWARLGLGKAQFGLKDYAAARGSFETVKQEHELALESYDWLARTLTAQGDITGAQTVLGEAVQRSPLAAQRQCALGRLAERNGELDVAEAALTQALNLSRGSFWPDLSLYCELSRVQLERGDIGGARRTAQRLRRESGGGENVETICELIEAAVLEKLDDRKNSAELFEHACETLRAQEDPLPGVLIEAARQAYTRRRQEAGATLVRTALRSASEDSAILSSVESLYQSLGEPQTGQALIAEVARDITALNNEAVAAVRNGDLAGASQMFINALQSRNGNIQLLLNAVNTLLSCVNQQGWNEQYIELAQSYLVRARKLDPTNGKARQLADALRRTRTRFGIDAGQQAQPPAAA
ncbi:response regulator [Silvimonas sp.]|uniref:response regulator n=1 Tax=Silvimonas sp. TaxID=2650811 RepID=UPI00283E49CE|nr:response regulator [Silvimonas sp.]MDR3428818.1 response regulator [Silvimonas sp.]